MVQAGQNGEWNKRRCALPDGVQPASEVAGYLQKGGKLGNIRLVRKWSERMIQMYQTSRKRNTPKYVSAG